MALNMIRMDDAEKFEVVFGDAIKAMTAQQRAALAVQVFAYNGSRRRGGGFIERAALLCHTSPTSVRVARRAWRSEILAERTRSAA